MARKRGGLAGIWDRNKQIIVPAASGLAGVFGGPLAGAAVGALARGIDRRSLGAAMRGGLEGYGAGALGAGVGAKLGVGGSSRAAVQRMLAPKVTGAAVQPGLSNADVARQLNPMVGGGSAGGTSAVTGAAKSIADRSVQEVGRNASRLSRVAGFVERNPKTIEMATKGLTSQLPDPQAQRQLDIQQGNLDLLRQRQGLEEEEFRGRQRAGQATREMLMPLYQQLLAGRGQTGSMPGSPRSNMASPPSSFLAGSGPGSMNEYLDLTAMGPGNRSMMPGTMRPGTGMGDYLESTGAFVGRQELPDMAAGERFGMAGTMPRRQSPSMTRRSPGGFMILDDTSRGY